MTQDHWDALRAASAGIAALTFVIMGYQAIRRWRRIYTWKVRVIWLSVFFASATFGLVTLREISLEAPGGYIDVVRICALILLLITAIAPIDDGESEEFPKFSSL